MGLLAALEDSPAFCIPLVQLIDQIVRILKVKPCRRHPVTIERPPGEYVDYPPCPAKLFPQVVSLMDHAVSLSSGQNVWNRFPSDPV